VCSSDLRLQQRLPEDVGILSISVDPAFDGPGPLQKYGAYFGAQAGRWHFLTGPRDRVYELVERGFRQTSEPVPGAPAERFVHSTQIALVDRSGAIRGFYDAAKSRDMKRLVRDVKRVRS
jgi:protein SCO1/2